MARLLACPVAAWVVWVVWIIKPALIQNDEGPELPPGLFFFCCTLPARLISLLVQKFSLKHIRKITVPFCWEFVCKSLNSPAVWAPGSRMRAKIEKIPC
jgi:hypothetical protein